MAEDAVGAEQGESPGVEMFGSAAEREEMLRRTTRYERLASRDDYHRKLSRVGKSYLEGDQEFEKLALVQWKPSMRNLAFPQYGRPMVVLGQAPQEMLPASTFLPVGPEEYLATLLVGYIDGDSDLVVTRIDPRRVMAWSVPDASE